MFLNTAFNLITSSGSSGQQQRCKPRDSRKHIIWKGEVCEQVRYVIGLARRNNYLFRLRMLSACGLLMYCSTICFQRRRHSQPLKKLWTFLIFCISIEPSVMPRNAVSPEPCALSPNCWDPMYKLAVPWDMVLWKHGRYTGVTGRMSFFREHICNDNCCEIHERSFMKKK